MSNLAQDVHEITIFRNQNQMTQWCGGVNTDGISHEESLLTPDTAGNSMNWIVGHLLCIYNNVLPVLGQAPVMLTERLKLYDRGSKPLEPTEAIRFDELMAAWNEACARVDAGLGSLDEQRLDQKAPFSPSNNPNETIRSVLGVLLFHQAYHAGQTGILRRVAGKPGAIK
jgi:hypothetical protein